MSTISNSSTGSKPASAKANTKSNVKPSSTKAKAKAPTLVPDDDAIPSDTVPSNNEPTKPAAKAKARATSPKPSKKDKKAVSNSNKHAKEEDVIQDNKDSDIEELTIPPEINEVKSGDSEPKEDYSTVVSKYDPIFWG